METGVKFSEFQHIMWKQASLLFNLWPFPGSFYGFEILQVLLYGWKSFFMPLTSEPFHLTVGRIFFACSYFYGWSCSSGWCSAVCPPWRKIFQEIETNRQFRKLREQNQMELKFPVRKARKSGALSIRPKILELLDLPTSWAAKSELRKEKKSSALEIRVWRARGRGTKYNREGLWESLRTFETGANGTGISWKSFRKIWQLLDSKKRTIQPKIQQIPRAN